MAMSNPTPNPPAKAKGHGTAPAFRALRTSPQVGGRPSAEGEHGNSREYKKVQIAGYAGRTVVPMINPLVKVLLVQQPANPAAFCASYFQVRATRGLSRIVATTSIAPAGVPCQEVTPWRHF